ncbi:MAG: tRNA (N6-isopentenyl adenosine(37)-C2)-methylthiotransferase MiaB [Isosphaeraceae bacterium]
MADETNSGDKAKPRLFMDTVGCQMNVLDSELVIAKLRAQGYELTTDPLDADTILFNTCSVRQHAEDKIYSALGRIKKLKQRRPNVAIGVLGCMAQKDQDEILRRAPFVDIVVGPGQLAKVPELLEKARAEKKPQMAVSKARTGGSRLEVVESFEEFDPMREQAMRTSPYQAFVRIMMGCDKFCTYCVVPATRGPEQSRDPAEILEEARILADQGVTEITLLGQTVNSYKYQTADGRTWRLSDLLYNLNGIDDIRRIKFITSFPKDMTDDLLQAVRDLPKVFRYIHVPAQSGCDEMLRCMKRLYTVAQYDEMMSRIRETIPGCAVSSDFIVGFCGETEESFEKSVRLVERSRFKNSFIFKYSPRPGTKAHELYADDVPEEVKKRRNNDLLAVQTAISQDDNQAFVGQSYEILVEGPSKSFQGEIESAVGPVQLTGRTLTDRICLFDGNPRLIGSYINVRVVSASAVSLFAEVVTERITHDARRQTMSLPVIS